VEIFSVERHHNGMSSDKVQDMFPKYNWKYAVQISYNLAALVNYVHKKHIVIGDFNPNNIFVDDEGRAVLVDCDSYDIPKTDGSAERYECQLAAPEYMAPELLAGQTDKFTEATDNFALAYHIFRLIFFNMDPFGGRPKKNAPESTMTDDSYNVINGNCPYVRDDCDLTIPDWAPDYNIVPPSVQRLFEKTFKYTKFSITQNARNRATAEEWVKVLRPFALPEPNSNLKRCKHGHVYPAHLKKCPWCDNTNTANKNILKIKKWKPLAVFDNLLLSFFHN